MLYFLLSYLKQTIYRIKIRIGNDLETGEVLLCMNYSVLLKRTLFLGAKIVFFINLIIFHHRNIQLYISQTDEYLLKHL